MTYLQSNSTNSANRGKRTWLTLLLALFLILSVLNKPFRQFVITKPLTAIINPFLISNNKVSIWLEKNISILDDKKEISNENFNLKEKNAELEAHFLLYDYLKKENEELKSLFSRITAKEGGDEKNYIISSIISKPPQSPYDILIIDVGSNLNIEKGMVVTAYTDVLLGYVIEVSKKTSKVKLISFPDEETNVMIESSSEKVRNSAIAIGNGGENFEINLPNSIKVNSGDKIISMGIHSLIIGIVEKVEISLSDPFQKIFFRLPVNIQELRYVTIEK